ncbi:hypothetical protein L228DRAFT_265866 [Xylona heveae TC161]|uniref:RING-type domain-containing protein n=1 Tax=Xylona heveae (strain CBS 132557 / TC161) TaxID=1328760 RepID=A0A161TGS7_XYLHT|nr:hypothetical protein L228DRAFT_265866 [Xylona heveae TC161]KZF25397.1 hypothetical protein L228DRAFT_265866 [Xylona heveae TC161]
MGQASSSQREDLLRRASRLDASSTRDRDMEGNDISRRATHQSSGIHSSWNGSRREYADSAMDSDVGAVMESWRNERPASPSGTEQNAELLSLPSFMASPSSPMEDVEMPDADNISSPNPSIAARSSYLSRLSDRVAPRYLGLSRDDTDTGRQRTIRRRLSERLSFSPQNQEQPVESSRRLPPLSSLSSRVSSSPLLRRRRQPTPGARVPSASPGPLETLSPWRGSSHPPDFSSSANEVPSSINRASRRSSRLMRLRETLSMPFPTLFPSSNTTASRGTGSNNGLAPPRFGSNEHSLSPVPQLPLPDFELDDAGGLLRDPLFQTPEEDHTFAAPDDQESGPTRNEREIRSLPEVLRRRRSRARPGEDQAAMLTRLLSVAAAATAASLMGHRDRNVLNAQGINAEGAEGSFEEFLQDIQNGRLTSALRNSGSDSPGRADGPSPDIPPTPFNFIRMFRFPSVTGTQGSNRAPTAGQNAPANFGPQDQQNGQAGSENGNGDGRQNAGMVPVIIVGIRSVLPGPEEGNMTPPFMDTLSELTAPARPQRPENDGDVPRRSDGRSIFGHRRRASMGGLGTFPSNYDSQRSPEPRRPRSGARPGDPFTSSPPPLSSDTTTGSGRSSTFDTEDGHTSSRSRLLSRRSSTPAASLAHNPSPSRQIGSTEALNQTRSDDGAQSPHSGSTTARQRGLGDSDHVRHRELGSGATRRNGVVEPDSGRGPESPRSWIIYVLGGSYPEGHPILTTPSLFTDNPTYEDMLMLSSLLGPAKPPVASREAVASAPGVYRVANDAGLLVAVSVNGTDRIEIAPGERCLVCLCDYEANEELRQLTKCSHLYHKECIDQWLTTGRNSCPLCRGQGVEDSLSSAQAGQSQPVVPTSQPSST